MKGILTTPETEALARRIVWFEEPGQALRDPVRFIAYALGFATHEDLNVLRRYVTEDDMDAALCAALPGIIRPRSWAYWHARQGRIPAPPLPVRRLS